MHASNKMCAGCHNLIDPIGFGFEKFDAIGMRREKHKLLFYPNLTGVAARRAKPKEIELDLDTKGWVAGLPNSEFTSPRELGDLLREIAAVPGVHGQAGVPLHGRPAGYSGRQARPDRRRWKQFRKSDFRFKELMVALVKSRESSDSREDCQCRK